MGRAIINEEGRSMTLVSLGFMSHQYMGLGTPAPLPEGPQLVQSQARKQAEEKELQANYQDSRMVPTEWQLEELFDSVLRHARAKSSSILSA